MGGTSFWCLYGVWVCCLCFSVPLGVVLCVPQVEFWVYVPFVEMLFVVLLFVCGFGRCSLWFVSCFWVVAFLACFVYLGVFF